jgi:hypothetical protein
VLQKKQNTNSNRKLLNCSKQDFHVGYSICPAIYQEEHGNHFQLCPCIYNTHVQVYPEVSRPVSFGTTRSVMFIEKLTLMGYSQGSNKGPV